MSDERALVDTNVLIHSLFRHSEHHVAARQLINRAQSGGVTLCIAPRVLWELHSVLTDRRHLTRPYNRSEAIALVTVLRGMPGIKLLSIESDRILSLDEIRRWTSVLRRPCENDGEVATMDLVAAMIDHGIRSIYTFNTAEFARYPEITVLTP